MNIGLLPLDERPVNTRYPAMIAEIAGARVSLPPAPLLSARRRPADSAALADWLARVAPSLDGLIVSCEMLGYGSLIASRISDAPASAILARLDTLRAIRRNQPRLPIFGFSLITRVSNANNAVEEPEEWATYGTRLYRLSQLLDRKQQGQPVADELDALLADVPAVHRQTFLRRRLRNHAVNLGIMHLLAEGVFDLLVLSSDDTSPYGMPSREKRWLAGWAELLVLDDRLLMYPGADEVGSALVARLLNQRAGVTPCFWPVYAPADARGNVAAYEDGPIHVTVERQIRAIEGRIVKSDDAMLAAVNAPVPRRGEWEPDLAGQEREARWPALRALVADVDRWQSRGRPAIVADVAYPNGADPALIELLRAQIELPALAAYGAWNTAGNTIGTALAQASAAQFIDGEAQRLAHERFLLHRFVEDWGYQRVVRSEIRQWLRDTHGVEEPTLAMRAATLARIEARLNALIGQLPGFAGRYHLVPNSVRLPWERLFEVDFELALGE